MIRRLVEVLIIVLGFMATTASAAIQTYSGVGEYFMTTETVDFAKHEAELAAEQYILEQVSVYVKEQASMTDHELDEAEIITIGAGILRVTDTKFQIEDDAEGLRVKAFVTAKIDTDELAAMLERATKDRLP